VKWSGLAVLRSSCCLYIILVSLRGICTVLQWASHSVLTRVQVNNIPRAGCAVSTLEVARHRICVVFSHPRTHPLSLLQIPVRNTSSGFGGLVVSMLASGIQDRQFAPGWSRRIFRAKNPQHAFLPKESKAVCPMSQTYGMSKNPIIYGGNCKL
jgi:hypothetical protein